MHKDERTFGMTQLSNLKSIADELECHTCQHIMRYIFQESADIERYSQNFRERFDIAFSQAVSIQYIFIYLFKLENYFLLYILLLL